MPKANPMLTHLCDLKWEHELPNQQGPSPEENPVELQCGSATLHFASQTNSLHFGHNLTRIIKLLCDLRSARGYRQPGNFRASDIVARLTTSSGENVSCWRRQVRRNPEDSFEKQCLQQLSTFSHNPFATHLNYPRLSSCQSSRHFQTIRWTKQRQFPPPNSLHPVSTSSSKKCWTFRWSKTTSRWSKKQSRLFSSSSRAQKRILKCWWSGWVE